MKWKLLLQRIYAKMFTQNWQKFQIIETGYETFFKVFKMIIEGKWHCNFKITRTVLVEIIIDIDCHLMTSIGFAIQ